MAALLHRTFPSLFGGAEKYFLCGITDKPTPNFKFMIKLTGTPAAIVLEVADVGISAIKQNTKVNGSQAVRNVKVEVK